MITRILRRAIDLAAIGAIAGYGLAGTVAAQQSVQRAAPVYAMTPERLTASTAAVVGLIAAIIGALALIRSFRRVGNRGRRGAVVALALGPVSLIIGGLVVATAEGGVGTGNGVAGAVVAIVLALIGMALSGLALARLGRAA